MPKALSSHQVLQLLVGSRRLGEHLRELFALLLIENEVDLVERIAA